MDGAVWMLLNGGEREFVAGCVYHQCVLVKSRGGARDDGGEGAHGAQGTLQHGVFCLLYQSMFCK